MTYVLQQFENKLKCYVEDRCPCNKKICNPIFERKNTDNPFGDYSAFLFNKRCKSENDSATHTQHVFHEMKGLELCSKAEHWTLIVDSIRLDCNRLILKINRKHANHTGFEIVNRTKAEYGTNSNFINKVFIIDKIVADNSSLTDLRTELTAQLVKALIITGGGSVVNKISSELEHIQPLKVGRTCFGENTVVVGDVLTSNCVSKDTVLSAEDYRKLRMNDMVTLSQQKENHLEDVQQLANAVLCFDMLSTKIDRPVTLDVSGEPMTIREHSTKGATFVLYNYARVCTILNQYNEKVTQKIYEPLPPIQETSVELLVEKEEWSLMFDYILEWPEIVSTCQKMSLFKLHNICSFLSSLSLCFSAFYRRCRVLTDPLTQLLPVMYARIHLLSALKQVYQNAFKLLSIDAPTHM